MIDTLTIHGAWTLRAELPVRRKVTLVPGVNIWARTSGRVLERVECSLPKLLFGNNGRVLQDQNALDEALAKLHAALNRIADVPGAANWRPWRVDMAWNFLLQARPLVLAHAALRVPGIRSGGTLYPDCNGVSWRGAKSRFIVRLYDKARKTRVPGSVLRAEISLRGEQLSRHLPGDGWRDHNALYSTYRDILTSIPPVQKPTRAAGWPEAVGAEPRE